ncbi:unnamed protein product [Auanema sp. JU1783]|nr:unnamed protein product [Auanema sp. JU1783]
MILERVIDETAGFDDFKKFWRLRLVNKEFNSIFSSDYAHRHFPKRPSFMEIRFLIELRDDASCASFSWLDEVPEEVAEEAAEEVAGKTVSRLSNIKWEDVPGYFRGKPFRINSVEVTRYCGRPASLITHAIRELANQASESFDLNFLSLYLVGPYTPETHKEVILNELIGAVHASKIRFDYRRC